MVATDLKKHKLDFFIKSGHIKLERGMVISKETMAKYPGDFPVYSSSIANNGLFGKYSKFMFDEEMITWSVDGGGNLFYRPKHKFSVTNVSGILRLTSNKFFYKYLYYLLVLEHGRFTFDYVEKAHPSVIRDLYDIPDIDLKEQQKIAEVLTTIDEAIEKTDAIIEKNKRIKQGLMQDLFRYGIDEHGNIRSEKTHKFKTVKIGNEEMKIPEEWEVMTIENDKFASITTGNSDTQDKIDDGDYPFYVRSDKIEKSTKYIFDGEGVLTSGDGVGVGKIYHYVNGKFDFHQRVYLIYNFQKDKVFGKYFYEYFKEHFLDEVSKYSAKTTVDSVRLKMISEMLIPIPKYKEQIQIANLFNIADKKTFKEQSYKQKLLSLKRGLMGDLLTGKVRVNSLITN